MSPSRVIPRGYQALPVHQVAQHQPVAEAGEEAGPEQERPVVDGDQRPAGDEEGGAVGAGGCGEVLQKGHDRQDAGDADGDDRGLDDPRGHVAQRDGFALPLEDGERTTAVPMPAMARSTSRNAPTDTRVVAPAPTM